MSARRARRAVLALLLTGLAPGSWAQTGWGTPTQGYTAKSTGIAVTETAEEVRIALAADVLFDFDKADITAKAADALGQAADIIRKNKPRKPVSVEGHTDTKGTADYNQALSRRRAEAVKAWLAAHGNIGKVKLVTEGFGAQRPAAPNSKPDGTDDPEGRQKNRRVEIVIARR